MLSLKEAVKYKIEVITQEIYRKTDGTLSKVKFIISSRINMMFC